MAIRWAIFISGGGTTMEAVLRAAQPGERLRGIAEVACIVTSNYDAGGVKKAFALGFSGKDVLFAPSPKHPDERTPWGRAIAQFLRDRRATHFAQLGWIPFTPPEVTEQFTGINQHAGPLDPDDPRPERLDFGGKGMRGRAIHAARLYFVRALGGENSWTEATVHWVNGEYDKGMVIGRKRVSIEPTDSVDDLQEKVLPAEHEVVIEAIRTVSIGTPVEFHRKERLVSDWDADLLRRAKQAAVWLYPRG